MGHHEATPPMGEARIRATLSEREVLLHKKGQNHRWEKTSKPSSLLLLRIGTRLWWLQGWESKMVGGAWAG